MTHDWIRHISTTIGLSVFVGACTPTHVRTDLATPPVENYTAVAVGEVRAADEVWNHYVPYVRQGMIQHFRESGAFSEVRITAQPPLPDKCIVVSGLITEMEEGSKVARFLVGFGAGSAAVGGTYEVRDAEGRVLVKFHERETYAGGAGIGGLDMLNMSELMGRMGKEAAVAVIDWKGGGLAAADLGNDAPADSAPRNLESDVPTAPPPPVKGARDRPERRFVLNGDGTVSDTREGLMWQARDDGKKRTFEHASRYCSDLQLAGFSDWSLPSAQELVSIRAESGSPRIDLSLFSDTKTDEYLSRSIGASALHCVAVDFGTGSVEDSIDKYRDACYVRCVRHKKW